jgi:hypothetical protein
MEVAVEILDVTAEEAHTLPLSIDPLASLAETQSQLHQRLLELTPVRSPDLQQALQSADAAARSHRPRPLTTVPEQYFLLLTCRDERHQTELPQSLQHEGLPCKALLS